MARGKRSCTLEEQYNQILNTIENYNTLLKEANATKVELENQIKMNRLSKLDELISKSGKSFEEIENMLISE